MGKSQRLAICGLVSVCLITGTGFGKKKPSEGPPPTNVIESKKKKSDEEPPTQVLPLPKEPPSVITADVERLAYFVTPLSGKGLLSQQTRDALHTLPGLLKGATVVHIRAFVAGSGDLRRVQNLISETFTDKRWPLPVINVIQVGAFPLEGAQVQMEITAVDKRIHNEHGLAFVGGEVATLQTATAPLRTAMTSAGLQPSDVRRITCYLSSIERNQHFENAVQRDFPEAAISVMQMQRGPIPDAAVCEGVGALQRTPEQPLHVANSVATVAPGKIAFTGLQLAFKNNADDVRIAFSRTQKALEAAGSTLKRAAVVRLFPLTRGISDTAHKVQLEFENPEARPVVTSAVLEGLPSADALFGFEAVTLAN